MCRMGMPGRKVGPADGLGLADAIGLLRDELLQAQAAGAGSDIQLPVESMTVVLKVTATRSVDVRRRPLWGRLGLPASSMAGTAVARWAGFAHGGVAAVG